MLSVARGPVELDDPAEWRGDRGALRSGAGVLGFSFLYAFLGERLRSLTGGRFLFVPHPLAFHIGAPRHLSLRRLVHLTPNSEARPQGV